jgi:hypothetical protein
MRDIGLCIMAQNDADLLTDNLQALRDDLAYPNGESAVDLARKLRYGLQKIKVGALLSSAHQARSIIIPKGHVLSTFELPGTMLPGNSISDAVNSHVAEILEEEKRNLTVLCNMKVGELLSLACERAFISPSVLDHGKHMGDWQQLMLDTAKELSDLSQKIALSTTSAELVEQELKRCRKSCFLYCLSKFRQRNFLPHLILIFIIPHLIPLNSTQTPRHLLSHLCGKADGEFELRVSCSFREASC